MDGLSTMVLVVSFVCGPSVQGCGQGSHRQYYIFQLIVKKMCVRKEEEKDALDYI